MCTALPATALPCPPLPQEQRIDISAPRTFQEASKEPLGPDWGHAEMDSLRGAAEEATAAVRHNQSNACPKMAAINKHLAGVKRLAGALPPEKKSVAEAACAELWRLVEQITAEAQLPLTAVRAGKVVRRQEHRKQQGRTETHRTAKALHPSRNSKRKAALIEEGASGVEQSDAFPTLAKKGKAVDKVRVAPARPPQGCAPAACGSARLLRSCAALMCHCCPPVCSGAASPCRAT